MISTRGNQNNVTSARRQVSINLEYRARLVVKLAVSKFRNALGLTGTTAALRAFCSTTVMLHSTLKSDIIIGRSEDISQLQSLVKVG